MTKPNVNTMNLDLTAETFQLLFPEQLKFFRNNIFMFVMKYPDFISALNNNKILIGHIWQINDWMIDKANAEKAMKEEEERQAKYYTSGASLTGGAGAHRG